MSPQHTHNDKKLAHILNLIVSDELKEIDLFIRKIRVTCKFVKK